MALATSIPLTEKHYDQMPLFRAARNESVEGNDCGVVALSIAAEIPYSEAHALLAGQGRENGGPTTLGSLKTVLYTWFDLLEHVFGPCSGKSLEQMCSELPDYGTHLIYTDEHVMVYKDGNLEDWYRFASDAPPVYGFITLVPRG